MDLGRDIEEDNTERVRRQSVCVWSQWYSRYHSALSMGIDSRLGGNVIRLRPVSATPAMTASEFKKIPRQREL